VPVRIEQALELGASAAYSPADAAARGLTAATVIEAAGTVRAFETAVALTAPGGTTITVGLPSPTAPAEVSPLGLVAEARTIVVATSVPPFLHVTFRSSRTCGGPTAGPPG
jgi:alcohol dehydrogenase